MTKKAATICDFLTDEQVANVLMGKERVAKGGYRFGFRAVHADLRSRDGFRYPWPGGWAARGRPVRGQPVRGRPVRGQLLAAHLVAGQVRPESGWGGGPVSDEKQVTVVSSQFGVIAVVDGDVFAAERWVHEYVERHGWASPVARAARAALDARNTQEDE